MRIRLFLVLVRSVDVEDVRLVELIMLEFEMLGQGAFGAISLLTGFHRAFIGSLDFVGGAPVPLFLFLN